MQAGKWARDAFPQAVLKQEAKEHVHAMAALFNFTVSRGRMPMVGVIGLRALVCVMMSCATAVCYGAVCQRGKRWPLALLPPVNNAPVLMAL